MSPCSGGEKPKKDAMRPTAAITAPPGTPGAAIIVKPVRAMKPKKGPGSGVLPASSSSAAVKHTSLIMEPARWTVAHSGITKLAVSGRTPLAIVWRSVTGMVAAEEEVPMAVMYAGNMPQSLRSGLVRVTRAARANCSRSSSSVSAKVIAMTVANVRMTTAALPAAVMSRKIAKM